MPETEPETLILHGNTYNSATGNFELRASVRAGTVNASGNGTFAVEATLTIRDGNGRVDTVRASSPITRDPGAGSGSGMMAITPVLVRWDRLGGTYDGTVSVDASAFVSKNGNRVADSNASRTDDDIVIAAPR